MRPWMRYTIWALGVLALLLILAAVLFPVFFKAREKARTGPPPSMAQYDALMSPEASPPPPPSAAGGPGGKGEVAEPQAAADRKIIVTGDMRIEVRNLDEALKAAEVLVKREGGFMAERRVSSGDEWRSAHLTIRVPAARFEVLHDGVRGLGDVREDNLSGEDVTKQWQDLEARLKIRKTHEQSLLKLLQRQGNLSDLLKVEKELWAVREQIEVAEGELRYLRDKVTLATLTVSLNEVIPAGVGKIGPWNLGYSVLRATRAGLSILRAIFVAVIYVLLAGWAIWLPLALIVWWLIRRRRARVR